MRLINADALKEQFDEIVGEYTVSEIRKLIDNAPTVEHTFGLFKEMLCGTCQAYMRIEPERPTEGRSQNQWKPLILKTLNGDDILAYESSCCRAIADKRYQHCPKCRAKMKSGDEE